MMLEPCGHNLFDSGSAYGYAYERRAERDLEKEPYATVEWEPLKDGRLCGYVTKSMYHFLCETLEYDSKLTSRLKRYFHKKEGCTPYVDIYVWEDFVRGLKGAEVMFSDNTYNHDSTLDGCFVFTLFRMAQDDYVVLATHNGCDARSGYAEPKVFRLKDEYSVLDFDIIWCGCKNGCPESEQNSDFGTCIYLEPEEWSETYEAGKYLFANNKVYCKECGEELEVS